METIYKTYLSGMTCLSCEDLILERLYSLKGVIKVDVSYFRSFIEIKYDDSILSKEQINYQLSSIGYLVTDKKKNNFLLEIATILSIVFLMFCLIYINLPSIPSLKENATFLFVFLTGVITGTHCISMCSGIMFVVINNSSDKKSLLKYQTGRLLISTLLGTLFGMIGDVFIYSLKLKSMIYTLCGLIILFMGICKWGIVPYFRKIESMLPTLCPISKNNLLKKNKSFLVGVLNGLLPCGASSMMWIYCASSGNAFKGALVMFVWCIGTIIVMNLFSYTNKLFNKSNVYYSRFSTIMMVTMGIKMLINGLKLF